MVELEHANRVRTAWYAGSTYWGGKNMKREHVKENRIMCYDKYDSENGIFSCVIICYYYTPYPSSQLRRHLPTLPSACFFCFAVQSTSIAVLSNVLVGMPSTVFTVTLRLGDRYVVNGDALVRREPSKTVPRE